MTTLKSNTSTMKEKEITEVQVGDKFHVNNYWHGETYVKVLAIAEGYVMARYRGCSPFCDTIKGFIKKINYQPKIKTA